MGRFMIHPQEGSDLHHCTKFEADSSIRSKVIKGSKNLEIRSRDRTRHFIFCTQEGPSSISVPNLKQIDQFIQKLLGGPKISKFGHMTQATPT